MALIVNDISVANESLNVYLDTTIRVTFNKNINASSLTDDIIHLYITENDAVIGTHKLIANHSSTSANIVEFVPQPNLQPNTKYIFLITGDHNMADAILQGITSEDGDSMSGNYYITFTSGTEIGDPTLEDPQIHTTTDAGITSTSSSTSSTYAVINTSPYNGQSQLTSVNEIVMYFNTPLTDISAINMRVDVERASWPYSAIDSLYSSSGYLLGSGYFNNAKTEYHIPVDPSYQQLVDNHVFGVYADSVGTFAGYEWFYMSRLWPAYADIRQIRSATGIVFDDVPDAIIWLHIHENSQYYTSQTGISYNSDLEVPYEVNKWVVCKTIIDLYNLVKGVNKSTGNIIRKTLGDLTIEYSSSAKAADNTVPEQFQKCADINWALISNNNSSINHTVKSINTQYYPGRNRRF